MLLQILGTLNKDTKERDPPKDGGAAFIHAQASTAFGMLERLHEEAGGEPGDFVKNAFMPG